jgi:rRNA methylases
MVIKSAQNKFFQEALLLREKKHRQQSGLFISEGQKQIKELQNGWKVKYFFVSESFTKKNEIPRADSFILSDSLFNKLASTKTPQGIAAVVEKKQYLIQDILDKNGFFIILENIQDPGNLGTIIRSADAFGAKGIFISKGSADAYSDKTIRSAMGSLFHIPVLEAIDIPDLIKLAQEKNVKTFAASLQAQTNIKKVTLPEKCAVIIGNEANGISPETSEKAYGLIKIPMPGSAESLNAAVAASIIMYELAGKTT